MPGVPSGRACDACRKQRKKCDEVKPSCARCTRLHVKCVGSGLQRYQFKEQRGFRNGPDKGKITRESTSPEKENAVVEVPRSPNGELTLLVSSFIATVKPSTSLKYNLAWTYGGFLEDIPRRLGRNEALDTSVKALVCAHSSLCSHLQQPSMEALTQYSRALKRLREYLDDPVKACASETLCAVMILLLCQSFIGVSGDFWASHCEGAAQILKARRYYNVKDDFECKLLLSLRGPVLFKAILDDKIQFTPSEWKTLVENELDGVSYEGQMMRCLARLPSLIKRGKQMRRGEGKDPQLLDEARANYETFKPVLKGLHGRLAAIQGSVPEGASEYAPIVQAHAHFQRTYALGLAAGIILGTFLSAIDPEDTKVTSELTSFSNDIVSLVEPAAMYRPLGSSFMGLCLVAAWVGTTDRSTRLLTERALSDYNSDFPQVQARPITTSLQRTYEQLRLLEPRAMELNVW